MQKKQRNGWLILVAVYYYSIVSSFNLLKAPPLFGLLMPEFGLDSSNVGYIVSASAVAALILVFPSALIVKRIGIYKSGLIAALCSVIGCIIGALAPDLPILLVGRFIEGCSLSLISIIGSVAIPQYFKGKKLGLPMAIWATWFPIGSALGSVVSSRIGYGFGSWRASWWAGAILAAIALLVFALVVRENTTNEEDLAPDPSAELPAPAKKQSDFLLGIKILPVWFVGLYFATLLISYTGFLSFTTEFFSAVYGMDKTDAGALTSLGYWFTVAGGAAAGVVSRLRKSNSLKGQMVQIVLCAALSTLVFPFGFLIPKNMIILFLFVCGLIYGYTCGITFGTVPLLVPHPRLTGISMGIIFTCQNTASFFAALFVGTCVDGGNWGGAVIPLLVVACAGLICAICAAVFGLHKEKKMQKAALPTREELDALKGELQQLQQELEVSAASLETMQGEKDALQCSYDTVQETLAALQAEADLLRQEMEQAKEKADRYQRDAKLAADRELAAMRQVEELKRQLNELKRMSPLKRMFWKG